MPPSPSRRTSPSRRNLERHLRRLQHEMLRQAPESELRQLGIGRNFSRRNSRAPPGTPSGYIVTRPSIHNRTSRRRGHSHNADLRRVRGMLRQRDHARRFSLAESRAATSQNRMNGAVQAYPFAELVERARSASPGTVHNPLIPIARAISANRTSTREPVSEYDLFSMYQLHGENLHRRRRHERGMMYNTKNRTPSPNAPMRSRQSPRSR